MHWIYFYSRGGVELATPPLIYCPLVFVVYISRSSASKELNSFCFRKRIYLYRRVAVGSL